MKIPPDNGKPACHNNATWLSYTPVEYDGSGRILTVVEYTRTFTQKPIQLETNVKDNVQP
jgi:hypothetical protein